MGASRWTSRSATAVAALLAAAALAPAACAKRRSPERRDAGVASAEAEAEASDPFAAGAPDAAPARAAPRLTLGEVKLTSLGWDARVPRLEDAALRTLLDAALARTGLLAPAPGADAGSESLPARLELSVGVGFEGQPGRESRADAAVSLRLRWKEEGGTRTMESRVIGQKPLDAAARKDLPAQARGALERALADATTALALRDGIRRGDEPTVIAALGNDDADVRAEAFRAVADRRLSAAGPRLIELLKSPNAEIRDAAIGALVELGDRRAVKPLVEMVEFNDLDMMRRIIDAVGMIGGDEARDYLEFVASGHETPVVRQLAQDALDRLRRREAKAK